MDIDYLINYYNILEIDKDNFDKKLVKKNYYKLSKIYHPDKSTGSIEKFQLLNTAYEILINDEEKLKYDNKSVHGALYKITNNLADISDCSIDYLKYDKLKLFESLHIIHYIDYEEYNNGKEFKFRRAISCSHCDGTGLDINKQYEEDIIHDCLFCSYKLYEEMTCEYCFDIGKTGYDACDKCNGDKLIIKEFSITPKLSSDGITIYEKLGSISKNKNVFGDLFLIDKKIDKDDENLKKLFARIH